MKIPCVPKLLASELSTLVRAKRLLTEGQGRERMAEAIQRESEALHQIWVSKEFPDKMMAYLLQLQFKSKEPTKATTQSQQDILKGGNKARFNGQPKL
ncbi:hypothetical protein FGO68_gene17482 [Halteria grandinella]|uniref:Uncharacterized protein n=1 Tax=Halteria grandinella TaxID=5974 RepID=A0A8J8T063_HALGN|nr:hypothetical protein FGO68_gene17482 [Halteria grandinella]